MYRSRIATTFVLTAFLSLASFSFASAAVVTGPTSPTGPTGGTGLGQINIPKDTTAPDAADQQCPKITDPNKQMYDQELPHNKEVLVSAGPPEIRKFNYYGKRCENTEAGQGVVASGICVAPVKCLCTSSNCPKEIPKNGTRGTASDDPAKLNSSEYNKQVANKSLYDANAAPMGKDTNSLIEKAILGETFSGPPDGGYGSYFSEFQAFNPDLSQSSFYSPSYNNAPQAMTPDASSGGFGSVSNLEPPSYQSAQPSVMSPDASAPMGGPVSGFGPPTPDGGGIGSAPLSPSGLPPDPWSAQQNPAPTSGLNGNLDANGQPVSNLTPEIPKTNWEGANPKNEFPYLSAQQIAASGIGSNVADQLASSFTSPDAGPADDRASSEIKTPGYIANATEPVHFQTGPAIKSTVPLATDMSGDWVNKGAGSSNFDTSSLVSGANDWWVNGPSGCTDIACAVNVGAEAPYVAFGRDGLPPEQSSEQTETGRQFDANGNAVAPPPPPIVASGEAPMWGGAPITGFDANGNAISDKPDVGGVKVAEGNTGTATDAPSPIPWEKISLQETQKGPSETTGGMIENAQKGAGLTPSNESPDTAAKPANYLAAEREKYMAELDANPDLRNKVAAIIKNEIDTKEGSQAVLESMVNRAALRGYSSLEQALNDKFYGPVNEGAVAADLRRGVTADNVPYVNEAINAVKSGSNICNYCTDQGQSWEIKGPSQKIGGEYFGNMTGDSRWAEEQRVREAAFVGSSGSSQVASNSGGSDLPYTSRPAGSYIDQQPLQNASYYSNVADTSTKMNGGWADNGTIADWNAGYAAVPPTLAAEYNGTVADWNAGFASVPATLATEQNGSVADWNAGYAAVPAPLAAEYNGTIADWNTGYAAVPQPLAAEYNGTVEDWYAAYGAVPPTLPAEYNGTVADWNAGFAAVPDAQPTIPIPGEIKITDVPPSGTDKPVDDVPLPTARPLSIPAAESSGGKTADIIAANAGSDNRIQPIQENVPLPPARPESAPTAVAVQEAAQQPPLERLANPDAKPWNSVEENSGNPYDSGAQKLVALGCQGGGGVCGTDSRSAASGGTPLTGDMQGIAVPRDNSLGLKIGDKVDVQVGDKTVENVPVTDYTRSGSNNYVASGGLEKELGGSGRDAALITPSAPEVPLPPPRPQDVDASGNPIEQAAPVFVQETEKEIPIEERIPVLKWAPDPFTEEYGKAVERQVLDEMSLKDRAVLGYGQAPADQLNPAIPTETIIPDKNLAYLDDMAPNDLLVSHEQVATEIANDQAARTFGDEEATVVAPGAKEPDLSVADLSYLNQFEPNDLLLSNKQIEENIANDQAARSFAEETGGGGGLSQVADNAPVKETTAATAIGEGEAVPLPQSRPDIAGARVQEAVGNAHSALQDVRDNTDQLEKVLKSPNSNLSNFKSAGNDVFESLKESRPVLQEAKQAALDAGDKKLADKIQASINQVNTSIARINIARYEIESGIKEALNDPTRGWVGRAYIENVAMERLRSSPKLETGLAKLRGIWIRR